MHVKPEPASPEPPAHLENEDMEPKDIEIEYDDTEADILVKPHGEQRPPSPARPAYPSHRLAMRKVDVRLPNFEYFPRHLTPDGGFLLSQLRHSHPAFFRKGGKKKKKKEMLVSAKSTGGGFVARPTDIKEKVVKKKPRKEEWVKTAKADTSAEKPKAKVKPVEVHTKPVAEVVSPEVKKDEKLAAEAGSDDEEEDEDEDKCPSPKKITIRNMDVRVERLHKNIVSFKYKLYKDYLDKQSSLASVTPVAENKQQGQPVETPKKKRGRKKKISDDIVLQSDSDNEGIAAPPVVVKKEPGIRKSQSVESQATGLTPVKVKTEPLDSNTSKVGSPLDRRKTSAEVRKSVSVDRKSASEDQKSGSSGRKSVSTEPLSVTEERLSLTEETKSASKKSVSEEPKSVVEQSKPVVELSDSSDSEKEDNEEVVENPFFTDSEDSDEGAADQAMEKEKLVEMLYSLIKGDERGSESTTLPTVPPPVLTEAAKAEEKLSDAEVAATEKVADAVTATKENTESQPCEPEPAAAVSSDPFDQLTGVAGLPPAGLLPPKSTDVDETSEAAAVPVRRIYMYGNHLCRDALDIAFQDIWLLKNFPVTFIQLLY